MVLWVDGGSNLSCFYFKEEKPRQSDRQQFEHTLFTSRCSYHLLLLVCVDDIDHVGVQVA
jgi:hypothetical protein